MLRKCVYVLRFFVVSRIFHKYKKRTCPSHTSCGVRCTGYTKSFEFRFLFHPSLSPLSHTQIPQDSKDFEISKIFLIFFRFKFFDFFLEPSKETQQRHKTVVCVFQKKIVLVHRIHEVVWISFFVMNSSSSSLSLLSHTHKFQTRDFRFFSVSN